MSDIIENEENIQESGSSTQTSGTESEVTSGTETSGTETEAPKKVKLSFEVKGYVDLSKVDFDSTSNLAPIPVLDEFETKMNQQFDSNNALVQEIVQNTSARLDEIATGLNRIEEIKTELEEELNAIKNDVYNIKLVKFKSDKQNGYRVYSDGYCEQWGYVAACVNDLKVTLQIPFRDNYFNVSATSAYRDTQNRRWGSCGVDSSSSIWLMTSAGASEASSTSIIWHAWGYVNLSSLDLTTVEG
jgi:ribosomal protein S17E